MLKIRWSKKERDLMIHYPDKCDGALIQHIICGNILQWGGIDGKEKGWLNFESFNLLEELDKRGYNIKTLKFEIQKK